MTKEAYTIYMTVKKSTFYLTGQEIMLRSDHLPLKKFLNHRTLNNTVDNWAVEIESFKIKFVHIAGKDNVLANTLSRFIDIDPDVEQEPELKDNEFGCYAFETLPKAFHNFLKACLSKHISRNREEEDVAPLATASYNWLPNQHSRESPFFIMFGRDALTNLQHLIKPKLRYMGTSELILDLELMSNIYQVQIHNLKLAR